MPPKVSALQHGAQSGSTPLGVRTLNNMIRKTKYNNNIRMIDHRRRILANSKLSPPLNANGHPCTSQGLQSDCLHFEEPRLNQRLDRQSSGESTSSVNSKCDDHINTNDLMNMLLDSNKNCEKLMKALEEKQKSCAISIQSDSTSNISSLNGKRNMVKGSQHNKQLDRMLRYMPSFNGKVDENYDSYVIGVRQALESYATFCTEDEKLSAIRVKIGGDAREILASSGPITSVEGLLSSMHITYGRDQRTTIADVKQKAEETVRMFANRLRMSLKMLGWVADENPNKPNIVSLEFFINGLLPSLSTDVRKLCPRSLDIAVDYAIQLESQKITSNDSEKKSKPKLNNLTSDPTGNDALSNVNRSIKDSIAALSVQIKDALGRSTDSNLSNSDNNNNNNNYRHHPYNQNINGNSRSPRNNVARDPNRPYTGMCFGCKQIGHTFYNCNKISSERKDEISANFNAHYAEYRASRATLNSKGVSTPAK
jgi:hypothetical protein